MRLLLILVLGIAAMGADCGGGGSSHSSGASDSSSVSIASPDEGHGDFAPAVPEPSALLVFGTGVLLAGAAARRKR
jgi:hypothetical protein